MLAKKLILFRRLDSIASAAPPPDVPAGIPPLVNRIITVVRVPQLERNQPAPQMFGRYFIGAGSSAAIGVDAGRRFGTHRGKYRVFNDAAYRFYRSNVAPPVETDTPYATNATLPATPTDTFADGTWYISMSYFNGVIDSGFLPLGSNGETYLILTISGGVVVGNAPAPPMDCRLELYTASTGRLTAVYAQSGAERADQFAFNFSTSFGSPADPGSGSPPSVTKTISGASGLAVLQHVFPSQIGDTYLNVRLWTRRNDGTTGTPIWVDSPSTLKQLQITAPAPSAPLDGRDYVGRLPEGLG